MKASWWLSLKTAIFLTLLCAQQAFSQCGDEYPAINDCCGHSFYLDLEVNYLWIDVPEFSYGIESNAAGTIFESVPVFHSDDTAKGVYPKGLIGVQFENYCIPYLGFALNFELYGFWSDDNYRRDFNRTALDTNPVFGGGATAFFPFVNGLNVVSATSPNSTLINGFFKRSYDYFGGGATLLTQYYVNCFSKCPFIVAPFVDFSANALNQDFAIEFGIATTTVADFNAIHLKENLKTTYYDIGFGVGIEIPLLCRISLISDVGVYASYGYSRLHVSQTIYQPPIIGPVSRLSLVDNKTIWSEKIKASLNLAFPFLPYLTILIGGDYEYWGYIPKVENPDLDRLNFIAVGSTHISNRTASNYAVGVKFLFHM